MYYLKFAHVTESNKIGFKLLKYKLAIV